MDPIIQAMDYARLREARRNLVASFVNRALREAARHKVKIRIRFHRRTILVTEDSIILEA